MPFNFHLFSTDDIAFEPWNDLALYELYELLFVSTGLKIWLVQSAWWQFVEKLDYVIPAPVRLQVLTSLPLHLECCWKS